MLNFLYKNELQGTRCPTTIKLVVYQIYLRILIIIAVSHTKKASKIKINESTYNLLPTTKQSTLNHLSIYNIEK